MDCAKSLFDTLKLCMELAMKDFDTDQEEEALTKHQESALQQLKELTAQPWACQITLDGEPHHTPLTYVITREIQDAGNGYGWSYLYRHVLLCIHPTMCNQGADRALQALVKCRSILLFFF